MLTPKRKESRWTPERRAWYMEARQLRAGDLAPVTVWTAHEGERTTQGRFGWAIRTRLERKGYVILGPCPWAETFNPADIAERGM